jgi:transcriptional regulator with XRE-family HTH domain
MSTRGERIRQALAERGIKKQQALAAELKVHESAITRWKDGKEISLENALAFSVVLDISLDWLLLGRGTIDAHKKAAIADPALVTIASRIGPRSLSLLVSTIESIADDLVR